MNSIPEIRIRACNEASVNSHGDFVLYWMIAYRRTTWNYSLQRAVAWAKELDAPLVILEALRCGYRWASDRLHRFILDGMAENARRLEKYPVLYYPYVEPDHGEGKGLLMALADKACVVVTDDYPAFFIPQMLSATCQRMPVRLELIDSNGILPMRVADHVFPTAFAFRRFLQKHIPTHLTECPRAQPLRRANLRRMKGLPREIVKRWPAASQGFLDH